VLVALVPAAHLFLGPVAFVPAAARPLLEQLLEV